MRMLFLGEASSVYTRLWAEHVAAAFGDEVHLGSLQDPEGSLRGVEFHPLGRRMARLGYLAAIPSARALARRVRPDLTVAYRVTSYGVLAASAGLHPLAMAAQGQYIAFPPQSLMKRALARYALSRADLITSWGAHMTRHMIALGCDPVRIRTIAYGIDCDRFSPDSSRPRPNDPPRLLTTRAMRRDYNLESILRALPEVARKYPGVVWTAVGEGPERARLGALAESLGIRDNVELPGRVPLSRLIGLLQACDVYLSTVPTDGVSASLLEAMACGAWPIVTDNEANRLWIRPGVTGDLVGAEDSSAIARSILEVFENSERRKAAREANITLVRERASLSGNMEVIHRMFQALVEEGPAAVPPVPEHLVVPPREWSSRSDSP